MSKTDNFKHSSIFCLFLVFVCSGTVNAQYPSESPSPSEFGESILVPSDEPSLIPSDEPSEEPSDEPSDEPSEEPDNSPPIIPIPVPDSRPDADPSPSPEGEFDLCNQEIDNDLNFCLDKADEKNNEQEENERDQQDEIECEKQFCRNNIDCLCKNPDLDPNDPLDQPIYEMCLSTCEIEYQKCMCNVNHEYAKCMDRIDRELSEEEQSNAEDHCSDRKYWETNGKIDQQGNVQITGCVDDRDECKRNGSLASVSPEPSYINSSPTPYYPA